MKKIIPVFLISVIILCITLCFEKEITEIVQPFFIKPISCLTYSNLTNLSKSSKPSGYLYSKLQKQLLNPYIVNRGQEMGDKGQKNYVRVAHWNIERGLRVDKIKNIFLRKFSSTNNELRNFINSDIISLNEVDIGVPRTNYRNIVAELADVTKYNHAFATEFVELNSIYYKEPHDPKKFLGLHGNAILSKYPIKSARVVTLPNCYKWYESESSKKSPLEYGRRFGAKTVFQIRIGNEIRHGSRCALVVNIELPTKEIITVVSTHLEDKCYPACRLRQMEYLLNNLKSVRSPLILAGDLNTTTTDTSPTSVKKEVGKRIKDPHFIARQFALALIPGLPPGVGNLAAVTIGGALRYKDPLAPSVPILFPNQEKKLFNYLEDFKFNDGERFDFSGDRGSNGKDGPLASSNERQLKGFESTFSFERSYGIVYFKLDWFFVKPKRGRFEPFNGQTLKLVNHAFGDKISDHDPITVDLTL